MKHGNTRLWRLFLVLGLAALLAACGGSPTPEPEATSPPPTDTPPEATSTTAALAEATATATATETPSPAPTVEVATATPSPTPTSGALAPATPSPPVASRCQGLSGSLEVQVLVGPAEAVGLEPVAVGQVPFAVTTQQSPYLVEGQGPITYEDVLQAEWGTYTVNMDLDTVVTGECTGEAGGEQLDLALEMSGEQLVVVEAEGFYGEYPWTGTQTRDLSYPLEEGATAQGEGWAVVLHLGSAP